MQGSKKKSSLPPVELPNVKSKLFQSLGLFFEILKLCGPLVPQSEANDRLLY